MLITACYLPAFVSSKDEVELKDTITMKICSKDKLARVMQKETAFPEAFRISSRPQ